MKISIGQLLQMKKDLNESYELCKNISLNRCFDSEHVERMKQIRAGVKYIDKQINSIDIEIEIEDSVLSQFSFREFDNER